MNTLKLIEIVDEADDLAHSLALVPAETLIKFAELIVRECIDTAFHKGHPDLEFLLKHFGVEE